MFKESHIKLSWNQNGSDGNTEMEAHRIKRLKDVNKAVYLFFQ
jgi:hypothetical protein